MKKSAKYFRLGNDTKHCRVVTIKLRFLPTFKHSLLFDGFLTENFITRWNDR